MWRIFNWYDKDKNEEKDNPYAKKYNKVKKETNKERKKKKKKRKQLYGVRKSQKAGLEKKVGIIDFLSFN